MYHGHLLMHEVVPEDVRHRVKKIVVEIALVVLRLIERIPVHEPVDLVHGRKLPRVRGVLQEFLLHRNEVVKPP